MNNEVSGKSHLFNKWNYSTEKGSPQGGVISPLFANIYLHVLDSYWENHKEQGIIVRYADDAVIVCKTRKDAVLAFERLKRIMTKLKLTSTIEAS